MTTHPVSDGDPRDVFLTPAEVIARYRWKKTAGYQRLRHRTDSFPPPIGTRYRLDTLKAWEEGQLNGPRPVPTTGLHPTALGTAAPDSVDTAPNDQDRQVVHTPVEAPRRRRTRGLRRAA